MNAMILLLAGALTLAPIGYFALDDQYYAVSDPDTLPAALDAPAEDDADADAETRAPDRYEGTQTITLSAGFPYPTCPLQCTMGYGFFGSGGLDFPVPEGATRIVVNAVWDSLSPAGQTLDIGLYVENGCGEGCWMGVEGGEGTGSVSFVYSDPEPGTYGIHAGGSGPAYVVAKQDVWLEAVIEFS